MSDNSEEFSRYAQIAHDRKRGSKTSTGKKKVDLWRLVFKVGDVVKEELVRGNYALCQHLKNNFRGDSRYKIIPVK